MMPDSFDPYHKWLGIPREDQPANYYRLLGLRDFESDPDVIDLAANKQMVFLHGCSTGEHFELAEQLLNEISAARLCLLGTKTKRIYDAELRARSGDSSGTVIKVSSRRRKRRRGQEQNRKAASQVEDEFDNVLDADFDDNANPRSVRSLVRTRRQKSHRRRAANQLRLMVGGCVVLALAAGAFLLSVGDLSGLTSTGLTSVDDPSSSSDESSSTEVASITDGGESPEQEAEEIGRMFEAAVLVSDFKAVIQEALRTSDMLKESDNRVIAGDLLVVAANAVAQLKTGPLFSGESQTLGEEVMDRLVGLGARERRFVIDSGDGWRELVNVRRGDYLILSAAGEWNIWPDGGSSWKSDAEGTQYNAGSSFPLPGSPQGALIGRINSVRMLLGGVAPKPFLAGKWHVVQAEQQGYLELSSNDDHRISDNRGSLSVRIVILADQRMPAPTPLQTNSIGMKFKLLPSGVFTMGATDGENDETPHRVTLTQPFELGVYEVTQEQYERVMGTNPSKFKGARNPVEQVSWDDAVEFCRKLSALPAEKSAGHVYRLPTEAEWEYACRAGTTTEYSFGNDESELREYALYGANSGSTTHPVGGKKPNAWGLYDMHGNVWEWCHDWYDDYPSGAVSDPTGPSSGSNRVYRGSSWSHGSEYCRSAYRHWDTPAHRDSGLGFRVVRNSVK